ncbi:MAG TPA: hypothetical protein VM911_16430 [Pyrinomonadaceae bacterium]|jgi:hypothetical protein|nr:hypothetical protein [Pyrinomonadaceae bacterium]
MRLLIFIIALYGITAHAQESFRLPNNPRGIIIDDVERMKVKDPDRQLSDKEKHELCRMFVKAYVISLRRHLQDYSLRTGAPIYRLTVRNFPGITARAGEGGSIIFLGSIVDFFNASPDYRNDVIQVLREGVNSRYCNR